MPFHPVKVRLDTLKPPIDAILHTLDTPIDARLHALKATVDGIGYEQLHPDKQTHQEPHHGQPIPYKR